MNPFDVGRRERARLLVKSLLAATRKAERLLNELPAPVDMPNLRNAEDRRIAARHWAAVNVALVEAAAIGPQALEAATEAAREVRP